MAQRPDHQKEAEKRTKSRAERREADRLAQQARLEQAAKERRQQTIIGVIVIAAVVVLLVVAGIAVWRSLHPSANDSAAQNETVEQSYTALQNVDTKPSKADDQGGILISKDGYGKSVEGAPTIGIYMDFLCPGCGNLNRNLDADLIKMMNAGQINLDLHFMSFMDRYSTDDYSSRAANSALYLAEHDDDPSHLLDYIANLYKDNFQPEEGSSYESVSDDDLKEQMAKAGASQSVVDKAFDGTYNDWLTAVNTYTPKREDLWNTSGSLKGSMSTPTVTINGYFWDMNQLSLAHKSMVDGFLESIGLSKDDIGKAGVMPSIGATGKPISLSTGE